MKLLLTSGGVTNASIHNALLGLKVGNAFIEMRPPMTGEDRALGFVDFSIFPHLDHPGFDENTMACAERWAAEIGGPAYAIDDQTAIQVVDGKATVITKQTGATLVVDGSA